jgi:hypothetical protein
MSSIVCLFKLHDRRRRAVKKNVFTFVYLFRFRNEGGRTEEDDGEDGINSFLGACSLTPPLVGSCLPLGFEHFIYLVSTPSPYVC